MLHNIPKGQTHRVILNSKWSLGWEFLIKWTMSLLCPPRGQTWKKPQGKWWVVEALDLDGRRHIMIVEFCSTVALLKILSITLARGIKLFTGLCLGQWVRSFSFRIYKLVSEGWNAPHKVFYPAVVHFLCGFTFFKQKLSLRTERINWHVDAWLVGLVWFSCLTLQDLHMKELPEAFIGADDF